MAKAIPVGAKGEISFTMNTTDQGGLARVSLTCGGDRKIFQFWGGRENALDGWNVIEEHLNGTLSQTHTWGTDLSGTLQGAGGVGGLLLTETTGGPSHFAYDGNGNVTTLTDTSGAVTASYRYDAFGNTLVTTGPAAAENKFRFSTKPVDGEVAVVPLYYYGYRYYVLNSGRWLGRDPAGENAGINLYSFCNNNPEMQYDYLGREPASSPPPGGTIDWSTSFPDSSCTSFAANGNKPAPAWNPTDDELKKHDCRAMNDPEIGPPEPCDKCENEMIVFTPANSDLYHVVGTASNGTYCQQLGLGGPVSTGGKPPGAAAQMYYDLLQEDGDAPIDVNKTKKQRYCCKKTK